MARRLIKGAIEKNLEVIKFRKGIFSSGTFSCSSRELHSDWSTASAKGSAEASAIRHWDVGGSAIADGPAERATGLSAAGNGDVCGGFSWPHTLQGFSPGFGPPMSAVGDGDSVGGRMGRVSGQQLPFLRGAHHWRNLSIVPHANGKRKFMIDTLALVRKLEAQGLSPQQAEGITALITQIMNESMEDISANFVSRQDMQMTEMMAETALSKFKNEMQSTQEQNYDSLRRETERLRSEIEKLRSELRYEMDKVTAGQRLDMNLEKGRMREELQKQSQETGNLNNKLDREINSLKAEMEAAKFDVIKYCVGTLVSVSAVGLGLLRILM